MATEPAACTRSSGTRAAATAPFSSKRLGSISTRNNQKTPQSHLLRCSRIRASNSHFTGNDRFYNELGMFSLRRKIEDTVIRAEVLGPPALEREEAEQIRQEELMRDYNLWDDPDKSNEMLGKLADSTRVVDSLKYVRYKAEEVKLISELTEMDAFDSRLFKQAYISSLDVGKLLDRYELSKLLRGPYETEGACLTIKAGSEGRCPEMWAERILRMYTKWAKKQGYKGRIVEKQPSKNGGISCATIEFEAEYAYGYLLGERGVHCMISSYNGSGILETSLAAVDVIPIFLDTTCDLQINDEELAFSSPSPPGENQGQKPTVSIRHIPTGLCFQSSGERNQFANKIKALNRLKAKLLVTAKEQGVVNVSSIKRDEIVDIWENEIRRYVTHPNKLVQDVRTGIQLPGVNYVLDGNIEPLIAAHIDSRLSVR